MFGFSIYLNEELTASDHNYLLAMRNAGFQYVFTSLLLDSDPASILKRLSQLAKWCRDLELKLIADVSQTGLQKLGIDINDVEQIKALDIYGLRIDDGILMRTVAKLSQAMPIALNASTITMKDLTHLKEENANFDHLDAWHNFYPHPETGLATDWLKEKNEWLKSFNLKTIAFVSGDGNKRGPIYEGLPTVEQYRYMNPLAASMALKKLGSDYVFIGDSSLKDSTIDSFEKYLRDKVITLHMDADISQLSNRLWHNRPDVAANVIRLNESRQLQLFNTVPQPAVNRLKGTITCDNDRYGRYAGEVQITKVDLPANPKVNVLGKIVNSDLDLLDYVGSNQAIAFEYLKNLVK
ncbi:hypothetical protein J2Z60_001336 [Lactobacillus colini]|uniref:Outer surface protein n=1 Tax=Lactobacillus colini TaxID=1819254 RepID=A0ABS4MFK8_9LACO|nr:MupG family TIM beta-alpha barrel fold protein [Lactobacillus colini]MBP2058159.1 hypothetical protein [Lactobacillus colini]